MNSEDLYRAIGKVDDTILEQSEAAAKKGGWVKWAAMAACLCLVIAGFALWKQLRPVSSGETGITVSENGVTIPPAGVSLSANEAACMMGFFIYRGRCYSQYERIDGGGDLVGEYLGTATGLIDEWTPRDGYVELAGSVGGDFYSVKGYDPAFLLCMKEQGDEISLYIHDNGITLKLGSELYEDRLHLSGNLESIQYESRVSWYFERGERYQISNIGSVILDFIAEMDSAGFLPCDSVPLDTGKDDITDTELYHLYFRMKDGITIHLRLHENGYVRFQGLLPVCVKIPEESCNALLELLNSHTDSIALEPEPAGPTFEDCLNDAELGGYVPTYAPEDLYFASASINGYPEDMDNRKDGTKEISLSYESLENPRYFYTLTVIRTEEYEQSGWSVPLIDDVDLSVEAISEYIQYKTKGEEQFSTLDVGVRYGDASVAIFAYGVDAETAYEIFRSIPKF